MERVVSLPALLDVALLIVTAKAAERVLGRLGLHAAVACTLAGAVLGPLAGVVEPTAATGLLLSAGAVAFFFIVGLDEIDVPGFLAAARGRYLAAAALAVGVAVLAGLAVTADLAGAGFNLGLDLDAALALAGILALSSVGVVSAVLAGKGLLRELVGLRLFTTVIIAEALALLLVAATISGFDHGRGAVGVLAQLATIAGFALAVRVFAATLLPRGGSLLRRLPGAPLLSFALLAGSLALAAVAAGAIGLNGLLGALLLGACLSDLPHRTRDDLLPGVRRAADAVFVPLLFASAGLHLDLSFAGLPAAAIAALVCIPLAGKFAGALLGARLAGLDTPFAVAMGLMAKGTTEIALLAVLLQTGAIGREVFSLLVLVMFGYILLAPRALGAALDRAGARERPARPRMVLPSFARHALAGVTVNAVLDRTRVYPGPELPVRRFLEAWTVPYQYDYLVVEDGAPAGIVSLSKLRAVAGGPGAAAPLRDVLRQRMPRAWPDEPIDDVLQRMAGHWVTVVPVLDRDSGALLGTVTSHDLLDLVALMDEIEDEVQRQAGDRPAGS